MSTHAQVSFEIANQLASKLEQLRAQTDAAAASLRWMDAVVRRTGGEHWWTGRIDNMGLGHRAVR